MGNETSKIFRRSLLHSATLLLATAAVSAANTNSALASDIKIVFGNPAKGILSYLPLRVGLDKGYFAQEGIDVEVLSIGNASVVMSALESGSIDMIVETVAGIANGFKKGVKLRIVSGMIGKVDWQMVVRKDSGIPRVGQPGIGWKEVFRGLRGKTLALAGVGGTTGLTITALAKDAGIDPSSFTMLETGAGGPMLAALESEQAQAFFHSSATTYAAVSAGIGEFALDVGRDIPEYFDGATYAATIVLTRTLEKYPDFTQRWRRALQKAVDVILDPANESYLVKIQLTDVDDLGVTRNFPELPQVIRNLRGSFSASVPEAELNKGLAFFKKIGVADEGVRADQLIVP